MPGTPLLSLFATLALDAKAFDEGLSKASEQASGFGQDLSKSFDNAGKKTKALSGVGAGLVGMLGGLAYKAGLAADDLNTMSTITGVSTESLQKMQYAGDLVDVSVDTITGSLKKMTQTMNNAKNGNANAAAAFERLGIKVTNSNGTLRDSEEVFYEVIEALSKVESGSDRDAQAMELFGKSAQDLNPIINDGAKRLKELGEEAKDAGLIMSQDALDGANKLNDAIDTLKARVKATSSVVGAEVAETLAPVVEKVGDWIAKVMEWVRNLGADKLLKILKISAIVAAISPVLTTLGKVTTAMTMIFEHPLILAGAVVVGAIVAIVGAIKEHNSELSETQKVMQETKSKYDDVTQSVQNNLEAVQKRIDAQKDYASTLSDEHQSYMDLAEALDECILKGDIVKLGKEEEAKIIIDQLQEALGIELELVDGQIKGYGDLKDSIYEAIDAKRAESYLKAYEDDYNAALEAQVGLWNDVRDATQNYSDVTGNLNSILARKKEIEEELQYIADNNLDSSPKAIDHVISLRGELADLSDQEAFYGSQLQQVIGTLANANEAYDMNRSVIENYERAVGYAETGSKNLDEALLVLSNGMRTAANADAQTLQKQLDDFEQTYADMKSAVEDGGAKINQQQFNDLEKMIQITKTELSKAKGEFVSAAENWNYEFERVGGNMAGGIARGIQNGSSSVAHAIETLASNAVARANKALKISSPSKVMMQTGMYTAEGFALGIEDGTKLVDRAMDDLTSGIEDTKLTIDSPTINRPEVGGMVINMTINANPNEDLETLAERISEKIAERTGMRRAVYA